MNPCVMSCNTHKKFADKFWPILDFSNHPCHLHMTSKIPGKKFPHSNSVVVNFQPWTLPIVKSCLFFSLTLPPCALYSCIHCLAVLSFAPLLPLPFHLS